MGYGKCWIAAGPHAAGPQKNVEVQHARPPTLAATDATEMAFNFMQSCQQGRGLKCGRHDRSRIGKAARRGPHRNGLNGGRMRKYINVVHLQRGYRLRDDTVWRADDGMWLI